MSTQIVRTGDTGQNFTQQTIGETPNRISVSTNAKGAAQLDITLYYATSGDMAQDVADDLTTIIGEVRRALSALGITLAGQEGGAR